MYSCASPPPPHPSSPSRRSHGTSTKPRPQKPVPPIIIAVMGATGSGKTSFINMASRSNPRIGMDLESGTSEVQLADEFTLDRRQVILIDMPGFDDTNKSDTDILKSIAAFLATTYESGSKLAGVIYIHRISDRRFAGIAGRNFKVFRELCGDSTLKNVVLVTNMWGEVTQDVGEACEQELITNFFKPVLDKDAQLARNYNTTESTHDIIRRIMKNRPVVLQIQRELVDEHKDIIDTAAGEAVDKELNEQIRRHQAEMKAIQEEMVQALKDKDEQARKELEEDSRKLQEQIDNIRKASESMASNCQEEKRRMEETMRQMQEQTRQEREQADAAYRRQMEELDKCFRESANAPAAEREAIQQRINQLLQVSTAKGKLQAHNTYYMDGRMIVLSCDGVLFRIPYWHLQKHCPILLHPADLYSGIGGKRGTSDETPIPIGDYISAEEFTIFLDFFYHGILRKEIPVEEWCKLLIISSKLGCKEVRARAIDELTARKSEVSSVDRIELGNKYDIPQWHPEAYADAFIRESHLTTEEGEKLGLETAVKVLEGRDRCKRNGWSHSSDNNVILLVKEIFPPLDRPVAPLPRFAGRSVYSGMTRGRNSTQRLSLR